MNVTELLNDIELPFIFSTDQKCPKIAVEEIDQNISGDAVRPEDEKKMTMTQNLSSRHNRVLVVKND